MTNTRAEKFVIVNGPFEDFDQRDNEILVWTVFVTNEYGDTFSRVYNCRSKARAIQLGDQMARDRRLPIEIDCAEGALTR